MTKLIQSKIERFRSGEKLRVLDLFAGCGGISLGFQRAGFDIAGALELDEHAARTHAMNFHGDLKHTNPDLYEAHAQARDITEIGPKEIVKELNLGNLTTSIDVVVGGPPCQSFARVGRAKLREIQEHPQAFLNDARGSLYFRYLAYVQALKPVALLMENVPDLLNYGGKNIAEEVCQTLGELGYVVRYTLMNAVHYGVPEMRERCFIIAYHKSLGVQVNFPEPTHSMKLPRGYHGSRQVALKTLQANLFGEKPQETHYIPTPEAPATLPPAITAQEALEDLPPITLHLEGKLKRGARRFTVLMPYSRNRPMNDYTCQMRGWPGFTNHQGIKDHLIRCLPRDYAIFNRMNPGDQYPEAHQHAHELFEERRQAAEIREGKAIEEGDPLYAEIFKATVPPYDPGKFPNKWRKMEPDKPARTLMAHLGKDSYSHIHYDSDQARTISVREGARLQSFPDGFEFSGTMNPAFRQIGNAVPPLMAYALGQKIFSTILESVEMLETNANADNRPRQAI